jgi:hypothetical protein
MKAALDVGQHRLALRRLAACLVVLSLSLLSTVSLLARPFAGAKSFYNLAFNQPLPDGAFPRGSDLPSLNVGEILLEGTVTSTDALREEVRMKVSAFTLRNGTRRSLSSAKPKLVVLNAKTQMYVRGNRAASVAFDELRPGLLLLVAGRDSGSGTALIAREIALWSRVAAGRFRLDIPQAQSGPCLPLLSSVVSWWPGESDVRDELGTIELGATQLGAIDPCYQKSVRFVPGKVGRALLFDGTESRVGVCDAPKFRLTKSLSIECWVLVHTYRYHGMILFRGDDRPGRDPYVLSTEEGGNIEFHIESQSASKAIRAQTPVGQWIHVAATLEDSTGTMSLYINGALAAQDTTAVRPLGELSANDSPGLGYRQP